MISGITRFLTIALNTLISFRKINNTNAKKYEVLWFIFLAIPMSFVMLFFHSIAPELDYIFLLITSTILLKKYYKQDLLTTFITTTFSVGLNLCTYIVTVLCNAPIYAIFGIFTDFNYSYIFKFFSAILLFSIHTLILFFLFKNKRFKHGIPTLVSNEFSNFGFILCLFAIVVYSLMGNTTSSYPMMSIMVIIIFFMFFLLYFSWKEQIKRKLNASVLNRHILALENELNALKGEFSKLNDYNEELGAIIHRDNKIVPAMTYTVESLIANYPDDDILKDTAQKLRLMSMERKGMLNKPTNTDAFLCKTGNIRIDSIVNYMYQKAKLIDLNFEFICDIDISIIDNSIENDICTLIADAVENAIIATSSAGNKNTALHLKMQDSNICIKIYDSGNPFTSEALQCMGRIRYTSHKKTGGNGYGMMTTFEILHKYLTSYFIDEQLNIPQFTKCISIIFNKQHIIAYNGSPIR